MLTGGLLPFPRTGCVLYAKAILSYCSEIRQGRYAGARSRVADLRGCTRFTSSVTSCGFAPIDADHRIGHVANSRR